MAEKLTEAQRQVLRRLSGDNSATWPKSRINVERVIRALLDKGLIESRGWSLTFAGRRAINEGDGDD